MTRSFCLRAFAFPFGAARTRSLPSQSSDVFICVIYKCFHLLIPSLTRSKACFNQAVEKGMWDRKDLHAQYTMRMKEVKLYKLIGFFGGIEIYYKFIKNSDISLD